jgi:hypothetical protein
MAPHPESQRHCVAKLLPDMTECQINALMPLTRATGSGRNNMKNKTMKTKQTRREFGATALVTIAASVMPAPYVRAAEKKYDAGASDTEIKLG